ncbi:MAG: hypothetical protein ACKVOW_20825 [Chitinophagaceae bacterium]
MKKLILLLVVVSTIGISSYAQCDKKVLVTSSKTEHLDAKGEVERSVDETTTIGYDNKEIVITPGDDPTMTGTIKSTTCEWKVPFKEGKTVIKASLTDPQGQMMNLTITIEGKEGKISLLAEIEEMADRKIRVIVDKFEEKK